MSVNIIDKMLMFCYNLKVMSKQIDLTELSAQKRAALSEGVSTEEWFDVGDDQSIADFREYLESRPAFLGESARLHRSFDDDETDKKHGQFISVADADAAYRKTKLGNETIDTILGKENYAIGGHKFGDRVKSTTRAIITTESKPENTQFQKADQIELARLWSEADKLLEAGDTAGFKVAANALLDHALKMAGGEGITEANQRALMTDVIRYVTANEPKPEAPAADTTESIPDVWDEKQFSPLDLDKAELLQERLEQAYQAGDAVLFEKTTGELTDLIGRMANADGVDPVHGRLLVKDLYKLIEDYEARGGLPPTVPDAGSHASHIPAHLLERARRRREEIEAAKAAAAAGAEPEPATEASFMKFLEDKDPDDNEGVLQRYGLLKDWGMNDGIGEYTDAELFDLLRDDSFWEQMQDEARRYGYLPATPKPGPAPLPSPVAPAFAPPALAEVEARQKQARLSAVELDKVLSDRLDILRDKYVAGLIKSRGGHFFGKSKLDGLEQAYNRARRDAGSYLARRYQEAGASDDERLAFIKSFATLEAGKLDYYIKENQVIKAQNRPLGRFYDWWARQDTGGEGFVGRFKESLRPNNLLKTLKKSGAVGLVALVPGIGLGIAGAVVGGATIGAAFGAGIARGVGKAQFSRKFNKEADTLKLAEIHQQRQVERVGRVISHATDIDTLLGSTIGDAYRDVTRESRAANRKRLLGSVVVGASVAAVSGVLAEHVTNWIGSKRVTGRVGSVKPDSNVIEPNGSRPLSDVAAPAPNQPVTPVTTMPAGPRPLENVPVAPAPAQTVAETAAPAPNVVEFPAGFDLSKTMPWTYATDALGSSNPNALIQQTLDVYNQRTSHSFIWNHTDGQFWEGSHVINPAELAEYNRIMTELYEQSLETLPEAA